MNATHDPALRSWVESANLPGADFPIQNLPFGVFRRRDDSEAAPRVGIAIGDQVLDLGGCEGEHLIGRGDDAHAARCCRSPGLGALMALGPAPASALRRTVSALLRADAPASARERAARHLVPVDEAELFVPAAVGDYTDFYASIHHATNLGSMFRPETPLLPNYKYVPIGYHGRASSIVVSGTPVVRPSGQLRDDPASPPVYAPTRRLDYELEVGAWVGPGNSLGEPIPIADAERHVFGLSLVNDWSARDIQTWEYQPLGPFLAKSFATTVSPWVVTLEALEPFRVPAFPRPASDPAPLPYLSSEQNERRGGIDIALEVRLRSRAMRERGDAAVRVSLGRFASLYWTVAQLVTHQASNGCNLRPGDLLASGTVSGPEPESRGSLQERTWRGTEPFALPGGETRRFLEDGDEVIMRAWCEGAGRAGRAGGAAARIGFGECRGEVAGGAG